MTTDIEQIIDQMREAAEAANRANPWNYEKRTHCAVATPANVLAVLAALKEAQERGEALAESRDALLDMGVDDMNEIAALRAERDALAEKYRDSVSETVVVGQERDDYRDERDALAAALKGAETALLTARTKAIPAGAAFARRAEGKEEFVVEVLDAIDAALAQIKAALGEAEP